MNIDTSAAEAQFQTEWARMLAGEKYEASNERFLVMLRQTAEKVAHYNNIPAADVEARDWAIRGLLGSVGKNIVVNAPFR